MKVLNLAFYLVNLWNLLSVARLSNPESELIQDNSSSDQEKGRSSAPLTDVRSLPRVIFENYENDPNVKMGSSIVITSMQIPFSVYSRYSNRVPVVTSFRNRHVSSFVPRDRGTAINDNDRGVGSSSGNRPTIFSLPARPLAYGFRVRNRTPIFDSKEDETDLSQESLVPKDSSRMPPMRGTPSSSNIPNNEVTQTNISGNIPVPVNRPFLVNRPINNGNSNRGSYYPYNPSSTSVNSATHATIPSVKAATEVNANNITTSSKRRYSPDANLYAGMINDFAFDLVRILNLNTNFVISPISIFTAVSVCYLASDGNTKAQIEEALKLNNNSVHGTVLHQGMKDLLSLIGMSSEEFQVFFAKGMFVSKNYNINEEFKQDMQRYYSGQLQNVDFGNPDESMRILNDWVAQRTRNTIPNIYSSPPDPMTRVILLNAIYFKGLWKKQFLVDETYDGRFFNLAGDARVVPTMPLYGEKFLFLQSREHRHSFIKLPYKGEEISMVIALPNSMSGTPMPAMTDRILCHLLDAMRETTLDSVTIPKFSVEFTKALKKPLQSLGITDLFDANLADLSNLRKEKDLYVSDIRHKAIVEVSEEGTVASAKTDVNLVPLTIPNTTDFIADHPFAFYIIHEASGLVLFYGKIFDLGEKNG